MNPSYNPYIQVTPKKVLQNIWTNKRNRFVFLFIIAFAVGSHFFMHTVFDKFHHYMLSNIIKEAQKVATHIAMHQQPQEFLLYGNALSQIKNDFNITKIKLFDTHGNTLYSTEAQDIGIKNKNEYFYNYVTKGNIYHKIVHKNTTTLEGEIANTDIAEIYIPYMKNDVFMGASEIYYDITVQKRELIALIVHADRLFMFGMGVFILMVIAMLYQNSHNEVIKKIDDSKSQEMDIMFQQQSRLAAMGELVGNIAHQWRQPLSVITTAISGLRLRSEFGILTQEDIILANNAIIEHANLLSTTIENFKVFLKSNHERSHEFFIQQVIQNAINIMHSTYDVNFITIKTNFCDKQITYYGDESLLAQVILKILTNAKDVFETQNIPNKVVLIGLNQINNDVTIEISDNAGGIAPNILSKIFDPYFTTKHQKVGTGLGLYMSMQIIKNHFRGDIRASNITNCDGKGALFTIQFPIVHTPHLRDTNE